MLDKIKTFVDWTAIEKQVSIIDKTQTDKGGRPLLPLSWKINLPALPTGQAGGRQGCCLFNFFSIYPTRNWKMN